LLVGRQRIKPAWISTLNKQATMALISAEAASVSIHATTTSSSPCDAPSEARNHQFVARPSLVCHKSVVHWAVMNTTTLRRKKILIVEDEDDFATMLAYRLQRKGYETVKAFDGWSGLQQVQSYRPDVIVLDLMLPQMVGLEVCRLIRGMPDAGRVPIYILTAVDLPNYRTKGLLAGADGYFSKSHELPEMLKRIETVLAEHKAGNVPTPVGDNSTL